jgi:hypothetical protein
MTGLTPSKVAFVTVPWKPRGDGANVIWDTTKADVIWNSMTKDIPWPPKTPTGSGGKPLVTAPSKISVRVLNGTGIAGRGSAAAAQLRAEGFVVVSVANAPTSNYAKTTVLYSPSYDQSARTVIFATKAKVSTASGTGKILTVIVGTDWSGVRHVSIPSNSGSSGGSTNPTPKPADQSTCVG